MLSIFRSWRVTKIKYYKAIIYSVTFKSISQLNNIDTYLKFEL